MKTLFLTVVATILFTFCSAQEEEFEIHNNGLMYSESTMSRLKVIVDSLNLKFKTCDLNQIYASKYQARGHYISLDTGNIKAAVRDMEGGISFSEFKNTYPYAVSDTNFLIIKYQYKNYEGKQVVVFAEGIYGGYYGYEISFEEKPQLYNQEVKGQWIIKYNPKGDYNEERVRAFYFTKEFESVSLPEKYARLVQYADCLIDTTTDIHSEEVNYSDGFSTQEMTPELEKFLNYVDELTHKPEYISGEDYEKFSDRRNKWAEKRFAIIEDDIANRDSFQTLLIGAVTSTLDKGGSNNEFEEYVGHYYSKAVALELKRRRKVVGTCSMDNSPRIHAMNIAVLSAETFNWETFLRAHLNIMNDRFERASDGSYAWERRETYIRELEELEINVPDLLLGISVRIENPSKHHYFGSIGRLGRALAETKYADEIEAKLQEMIKDEKLDDYNRAMMYLLFLSYTRNLDDENRREVNKDKLKSVIESLPAHISSRIPRS